MKKRTKRLLKAARDLTFAAVTRSGNDEPTWLVPQEEIMALSDALDDFNKKGM